MHRTSLLFTTLLLTLAAPASAQETPSDSSQTISQEAPVVRSPGLAHFLSITGTIGPIALGRALYTREDFSRDNENQRRAGAALIAFGFYLGPGLGYLYGGDLEGRFVGGALVRLGATALYAGGVLVLFSAVWGEGGEGAEFAATALLLGSIGLATWSMVADWVRVGSATRDANTRRAAKLSATAVRTFGETTPGLGLALRF